MTEDESFGPLIAFGLGGVFVFLSWVFISLTKEIPVTPKPSYNFV